MNFNNSSIREVQVTRYVTPLREGGSLPAIAEANDGFLYVLKFRGAGQGTKALIAELLGGEIARQVGVRIPEIVFAELDEAFGRTEPDEEIQDLLKASQGLNLGMHFLTGAYTFDSKVSTVESHLASQIVWLDAYLMNVDRTVRNTNMLMWNKELWMIDNGAALYFHHGSSDFASYVTRSFPQIKDHVLLGSATELGSVDAEMKTILTDEVLAKIVALLPDCWLDPYADQTAEEQRQAYFDFLKKRLSQSEIFVTEAENARNARI